MINRLLGLFGQRLIPLRKHKDCRFCNAALDPVKSPTFPWDERCRHCVANLAHSPSDHDLAIFAMLAERGEEP